MNVNTITYTDIGKDFDVKTNTITRSITITDVIMNLESSNFTPIHI